MATANRKKKRKKAKKRTEPIQHLCYNRTWGNDKNSHMKFGFVENSQPKHDVIYYDYQFRKEAKSPEDSIYQQTVQQNGWVTIEEAMTIVTGLSQAILEYAWFKEEQTKKRFY